MCRTFDTNHIPKTNKSPLANLDPRVKLLISLFFALTITALHSLKVLSVSGAIVLGIIFLAKIPIKALFKRLIPALPFILPIAIFLPILTPGHAVLNWGVIAISKEGLEHSSIIIMRIITIVAMFAIVVLTTKRQELLRAALDLKIPNIFIQIAQFTFRYIEVIAQEAKTMLTARKSRGYQSQQFFNIKEIRELSNLLGMLFLRSYARAERVYLAMLARGYNTEKINTTKLSFKKIDVAISTCFLVLFICLLLVDKGGIYFWM